MEPSDLMCGTDEEDEAVAMILNNDQQTNVTDVRQVDGKIIIEHVYFLSVLVECKCMSVINTFLLLLQATHQSDTQQQGVEVLQFLSAVHNKGLVSYCKGKTDFYNIDMNSDV